MKDINQLENCSSLIEKTIYDKIEKYRNNVYLMSCVDPSYRKDNFNALKSFAATSKNEILTLIYENRLNIASYAHFKLKIRDMIIQMNFGNQNPINFREYFNEMNEFGKNIDAILVETEATIKDSLLGKETQTKGLVNEILENEKL